MSAISAPGRLQLRDFGAALTKERESQGYSLANLAKNMGGISKEEIRAWEAGHAAPRKVELVQLLQAFPKLRRFELDIRCGNYAAAPKIVTTPVLSAPSMGDAPAKAPRFATFGAALRAARVAAEMSQVGIGELCGVTGQAVQLWEDDSNIPVLENYTKLLGLFPELESAPNPNSRDLDVPVGAAGHERTTVRTVHFDPRDTPAVAEDASRPVFAQLNPQPVPEPEPAPMPEPTPTTPPVSLPAIVRWTRATNQLNLDPQQAKALSELLGAGAELGLGVAEVGQVLEQWPQRPPSSMGHR
jgi:transcriptional regulator with XRE-family HTH domain